MKKYLPFSLNSYIGDTKPVVSKTDHVLVQTEKVTQIYTNIHCIFITTNSQGEKISNPVLNYFFILWERWEVLTK